MPSSGRIQLPPLVATDAFVVAVVVEVAALVFVAVATVADAVGVALTVAAVTAAAVAVAVVAVAVVAAAVVGVVVRLEGAVEVVEALGVASVLDWSAVVLVAVATAAVEPTPPASPTVSRPALATEPTAAETLINRTRRRARSRCSTELRVVPRGFCEFVMLRPSGMTPQFT